MEPVTSTSLAGVCIVCGPPGSGKTTFLGALAEYIPDQERVVTIEDSAELRLYHI